MKERYLEVTFREGRPLTAYVYLPRESGDASDHVESRGPGLLVDRAADGRAIGIEITDPSVVTLASLNRVLSELALEPMTAAEVAPLGAG